MGVFNTLKALIYKNILLKLSHKGSTAFEVFLPLLLFYLIAKLLVVSDPVYNPPELDPINPANLSTTLGLMGTISPSCSRYQDDDGQEQYEDCKRIAIVPKNHPLLPVMVAMVNATMADQSERGQHQLRELFVEFDTMKEAEDYHFKNGELGRNTLVGAFEFTNTPQKMSFLAAETIILPTTSTFQHLNLLSSQSNNTTTSSDQQPQNLQHVDQIDAAAGTVATWGFTVHSQYADTSQQSQLFDVFNNLPYHENWDPDTFDFQNFIHQAILRYNGLYGDDSYNPALNDNINIEIAVMPTVRYKSDFLYQIMAPVAATMGSLAFFPTISAIVATVVLEKEMFIKQTLIMMGASKYTLYLSWYATQFLFAIIPLFSMTIIYKIFLTAHLSVFIPFFAFIFYYLSLVSFAVFITAFFNNAKTGQAVTSILFLILSTVGAVSSLLPSIVNKLISVASFQSLFGQLNKILWEANRSEIASTHPWEALTSVKTTGLTFLECILVSVCQAVIYFILAIYVDNIMPGEYNNPLPFYYPLMPSYWFGLTKKQGDDAADDNHSLLSDYEQQEHAHLSAPSRFISPLTEQESKNIGVHIKNLVKEFRGPDGSKFRAVDNASIDLVRGQIFSFLGHNGAGKSTTINVLTGIYGPTSGTIDIYDRNGNPVSVHNTAGHIGVCPQYNSLYPLLTVKQHLNLISAIKQQALGLQYTQQQVDAEIDELLLTLKLGPQHDNKGDSITETLSGGQKRKVCLAMALLHKPSILVLDEPGSGCDIAVTRQIWALLHKLKKDTTILLTTHSLQEAEIGDRIGIMVKGQLMCCGTGMFLKSEFGVGYTLNLEKSKQTGTFDRITAIDNSVNNNTNKKTFGGAKMSEITTLSGQRFISIVKPEFTQQGLPPMTEKLDFTLTPAQLKLFSTATLHSDNQSNIAFSIPLDSGDDIAEILELVEQYKAQLHVTEASLAITSLEDVFIMANNGSMFEKSQTYSSPSDYGALNKDSVETSINVSAPAVPVNTDAHALEINTKIWDEERKMLSPLHLFSIQVITLLWKRLLLQIRDFKTIFRLFVLPVGLCLLVLLQSYIMTHPPKMGLNYHNYPSQSPMTYSVLTPPAGYPATPEELQSFKNANTFAKSFATYDAVPATPLDISQWYFHEQGHADWTTDWEEKSYRLNMQQTSALNNPKTPQYAAPVLFDADFTNENYSLTGQLFLNSTSYFVPNAFLPRLYETISQTLGQPMKFDFTLQTLPQAQSRLVSKMMAIIIILICCLVFPETLISPLVKERKERVVHLHRISGVTMPAYWVAYFIFDLLLYAMMMGLVFASLVIFKLPYPPLKVLLPCLGAYGPAVILYVYMSSLFFKSPSSAQILVTLSLVLGPLIIMLIITIIGLTFHIENFWKYYVISLIFPSAGVVWPLFQEALIGQPNMSALVNILWKWACCIPIYMVAFWVLQSINTRHWLDELFQSTLPIAPRSTQLDPDVLGQEELVKSNTWSPQEYPLVAHGLRKVFGTHVAVNNLYFTMKKQQTFALLGSNGAGKSTAISLLTSDFFSSPSTQSEQKMTKHTAYISGNDIVEQSDECWRQLGFCPQFDALNLNLTGRETLTLYCWFRGVTSHAKLFIADLLNALGLEYAADRKIAGYSLGMRRRLSIGVALVGNPQVVCIDEGTSGVDAISRANVKLLLQQTCRNRALLVTSHNLEEIEALADNIGIMSRGEMKTIGTKNELKRKLTNHFQLQVQLGANVEHRACAEILSRLTNVPISPQLNQLFSQLDQHHQQTLQSPSSPSHTHGLSQSQVLASNAPITAEYLTESEAWKHFLSTCQTVAGCYLTECRYMIGVINVSKNLHSLSSLFKKIKEIQLQLGNQTILTYSCSQVPLDQVFLEIVKQDELYQQALLNPSLLFNQLQFAQQGSGQGYMQQPNGQQPMQYQQQPYPQQQQPFANQNLFVQPSQPQQYTNNNNENLFLKNDEKGKDQQPPSYPQ